MNNPYFSIVITTFNRSYMIRRCLDSCLKQTFDDKEIIVVDDGSRDNTFDLLSGIKEDCLKIIKHPVNRGISPARFTGVKKASGLWIIILDSDWELLPDALQCLYHITSGLSPEIGIVRSRLRWDTGRITPAFVPDEPIDYEGRMKWVEKEGGTDAMMCVRRDILEKVPYEANRRGAMEGLFQLNLALQGKSLYLNDILGIEHSDAPNSILRSSSKEMINVLRQNAPDTLWMCQEALEVHGYALRKWAPTHYGYFHYNASLQSFYLGQRKPGMHYMLKYLTLKPGDVKAWVVLALGIIGPFAVLYATQFKRKIG